MKKRNGQDPLEPWKSTGILGSSRSTYDVENRGGVFGRGIYHKNTSKALRRVLLTFALVMMAMIIITIVLILTLVK